MIKKFIDDKGIKYLIAIGGAPEYATRGIPHSWLVSPQRSIVWEGHPAQLTEAMIEQNLKGVRLRPEFKLPKALSKAEKLLNAGDYGKGVAELETYLKKPKNADDEAQAKAAIEQVKTYGKERLELVEACIKDREHAYAYELLLELQKGFKGSETGDAAKAKIDELKKDKVAQAEIEGQKFLEKAEGHIANKKYKPAAEILRGILKTKKYEGTKVRDKAERKLNSISGYL